MAQVDFNNLYNQYRSGNLVPILGPEVLKIILSSDRKLTLEEYIIENITRCQYIDGISPKNLSELTLKYPNLNSNEITGIYNSISSEQFDMSILNLLTKPNKFKFYITTSYDRKLEELLGDTCEYKIWNHENRDPLIFNMKNNLKKIVYLFGRIRAEDDEFEELAFADEDKMESLYSLSTRHTPFENSPDKQRYPLFSFLRGKTLLFIGNNFQDWFMKFIIRTLYNSPYKNNNSKAYIINDSRKKIEYEDYLFNKYNIQIIHDYPIDNFVKSFINKIKEQEEMKSVYKNKNVFISYDRSADKEVAQTINQEMRKRGINTWLDTRDLKIGEYEEEIRDQIENAPLFISIISCTLINKDVNESYARRVEWNIAQNVYNANDFLLRQGYKKENITILPIAVDDSSYYVNRLPEFIRKANIYNYDNENLFDDIEKLIKEKYVAKEPV